MKPHKVTIRRPLVWQDASILFEGSLAMCKRYAETLATPDDAVSITTNRGTTWKLKDGRWVHDTGRKS